MQETVRMPSDIGPERLAEIIAAERAGRCRVFPCLPGDTVWVICPADKTVKAVAVSSFHLFGSRRDTVETFSIEHGQKIFRRWKLNQFGKNIFLAEEDARAALEKRL